MSGVVIAVLIDAFGWRVLQEHPFLPELEERRPLRTVLGFSSAAIPSLLSGLRPEEHGRWFLFRHNPTESPFGFARLLAPFERPGRFGARVRTAYKHAFRHTTDVTGYYNLYRVPLRLLPRFDLPETRPPFGPGGLDRPEGIFDRLSAARVPFRSWYWSTPEERSFRELVGEIRRGETPFLFLYAAGLDGLMHEVGTGAETVRARIGWYEERIREALREAERIHGAERTTLAVFSDHGMVDHTRVSDLMERVRRLPFREGRDYLPFYDSTFARFWFHHDGAERAIRELLDGEEGGRLLTDIEMRELGVLFPGREYGEAIFLSDPGTVIAPSFMGEKPARAMHGYHPDDPGSDAMFLANRPFPGSLRSILDLAGEMERAARNAGGEGRVGDRS
ncbi:MAG: alkaline phosphatase family protein [Candidatus Eisenbacteria bacterium]|nr:alkaline phosphatase family protein [Candidatus Eisenbacteria bacterium]